MRAGRISLTGDKPQRYGSLFRLPPAGARATVVGVAGRCRDDDHPGWALEPSLHGIPACTKNCGSHRRDGGHRF